MPKTCPLGLGLPLSLGTRTVLDSEGQEAVERKVTRATSARAPFPPPPVKEQCDKGLGRGVPPLLFQAPPRGL